MNRLVIRPFSKMASIAVSDNSTFKAGDKITMTAMTTMWPKWALKIRFLWRFRLIRKALDWKYPPQYTTQDYTITGISGSDTLAI